MPQKTVVAICRNCNKPFNARLHDVKKGHGTCCSRECYWNSKKVAPIETRLWSKIDKSGNCWEYKERLNECGYGVFHIKFKSVLAHRVVYEITKGPIPEGKVIMHSCDNPACCNPDHLFLGTQADNVADMIKKGRDNKVKGEKSVKAKLCESDVLKIRSLYGIKNRHQLAEEFGVHHNTIMFIVERKTWKHI